MELIVIEETPKKFVFELKGQGHTICNILKAKLWEGKHVKVATYNIAHPLIGTPRMIVETDGDVKPRKAVADAIESLKKEVAEFKQELKKAK
jgi:DNA-directed RNA polymerase subunit L